MRSRLLRRAAPLAAVTAAVLGATGAVTPASAGSYPVDYCPQIPVLRYGIPPWGFHTGAPISTATGSYARGHGNINLGANTVSGLICKVDRVRHQPDRVIVMTVEHHLGYHSHYAQMWGYPGNIMHITVKVTRSYDRLCPVGTVGHVTLFASYNNVRSDSVQFFFPASCRDQRHLYHGTQVNNQVPPA
ncbi:MAG TPA: hypothetical protein VFN55_04425 [Solirubrobacteraceae bacterium]|nr:hypothetical protein [Solirubrobacteraceae bacterium]